MNIGDIACLASGLDTDTSAERLETLRPQMPEERNPHPETYELFQPETLCWLQNSPIVNRAAAVMYGRMPRQSVQ